MTPDRDASAQQEIGKATVEISFLIPRWADNDSDTKQSEV